MEKFSLEKYLENPNRKVVTRDGRNVRIICTNRIICNFPVVALVSDGKLEDLLSYTKAGERYKGQDDNFDLFFAPEKKERWINLFKINSTITTGEVYNTKEEAKSAVVGSLVYISTVKVEWEE